MKIHFVLLLLAIVATAAFAEKDAVVEDKLPELLDQDQLNPVIASAEEVKLKMQPYACVGWMCKLACRVSQKRKGSCVEDECICRNKIK
ncbi:hypothetical protein KM043_013581 [Ampulex compressa]|nr:hypothetical protein KM043_013581 [Ampulex compressa]